jgi:NADH-quinone oxidoreductase subunit J
MDLAVFVVGALSIAVGAMGVVGLRNPVHCALSLVMTLFGVAVLFVAQQAHFLAAVQVIVYAGAIVVLFLFVIMFLGVDKQENVAAEPLRGQRPAAIAVGVIALAEAFLLFRTTWATGRAAGADLAAQHGHANTERLAETLFTRYVFPFEVTSVLLVIAVVGAVVLVRRSRGVEPTAPVEAADRDKEGAPA